MSLKHKPGDYKETIAFYEEKKKKEQDPGRWADPKSWECLSDGQRDAVRDWYIGVCDDHMREKRKVRRNAISALLFSITPFAFAYAVLHGHKLGLSFLLDAACAYTIFAFVAGVFSHFYGAACDMSSPSGRVGRLAFNAAAVFISFLITYLFLYRIGAA